MKKKKTFRIRKGKGKVIPVYTIKAHRRSRCIALLTLCFSTRWRWVVNFTPQMRFDTETGTHLTEGW